MRGWGAIVLAVMFTLASTGSAIARERSSSADDGRPRPTPPLRAQAASRSDSERAFPHPLDVEITHTPENHDATRHGERVRYVVIHYTAISYARTLRAFRNPNSQVSAHYVVRNDGHVAEIVSPDDVAWHSGNAWMNDHSVGIEIEKSGESNPDFTEAEYQSAAILTCAMAERYGIPIDRQHIIGHVEVPGSTHTDPGPTWSWPHFMWYVTLCAPANARTVRAAFVAESPFLTLPTGGEGTVQVRVRNTGEATWRKGSPSEARLAIKDNSGDFAFLARGWLAPDRPAAQDEDTVAPGQSATFTFGVKGTKPGEYKIPVRVVIDGKAWTNDLGIWTVVAVR